MGSEAILGAGARPGFRGFRIDASVGRHLVDERIDKPPESQLNEVLIRLHRRVNYERCVTREQLNRERRWWEERRVRAEKEAERPEHVQPV